MVSHPFAKDANGWARSVCTWLKMANRSSWTGFVSFQGAKRRLREPLSLAQTDEGNSLARECEVNVGSSGFDLYGVIRRRLF